MARDGIAMFADLFGYADIVNYMGHGHLLNQYGCRFALD
jgi:hypothetical protein